MRTALLLLCCACVAPLPRPDEPGAADTYRSELLARPKGPRARQSRDGLETQAWDEAKRTHTVFALRRFLAEYPDSRHGPEGRKLLEGLRFAEVLAAPTAQTLQAYLADEPQGVHAAEAWSRLSALRLEEVLREGRAPGLRSWLVENPAAPGRERALAALDEADFREALLGDGLHRDGLQRYLDEHPDGAHRNDARDGLQKAGLAEAELLEDEEAVRAQDPATADRLAYARAAALLDEGRLAQLARRGGPSAQAARSDLAGLRRDPRRAGALASAAARLYLPRATLDELPGAAPERARRLLEWAVALDGRRLHRLLAELGSPRAQVALAALDAAEALLAGLPAAESRLRAQREATALRPLAQDAPQLAGLSLLELALGDASAALAAARAAAGRDPGCAPALWLAARLETEPGLRELAGQNLRRQADALVQAFGPAASEPAAAGELCAALRAAELASALGALGASGAALGARSRLQQPCPEAPGSNAPERLAGARALVLSGSPLARAALARAAARDPDSAVRSAAQGALAAAR